MQRKINGNILLEKQGMVEFGLSEEGERIGLVLASGGQALEKA